MERGATLFHKSLDCRQLTKRPATGKFQDAVELDLNDLKRPRPCRTCYPDAPVAKSVHRLCPKCNHFRVAPCPHNGGVPVLVDWTRRKGSILTQPGENYQQEVYVWPEHVHQYV